MIDSLYARKALEELHASRNTALEEVDRLRHEVDKLRAALAARIGRWCYPFEREGVMRVYCGQCKAEGDVEAGIVHEADCPVRLL